MKVLIIGGVAGGMSAATRLRRLDEAAEIVVLERGDYVSFANCGLPYYLGGEISQRDDLLLQTPESLQSRFRLDVRVGHDVTAIDTQARTVHVRTADGEFDLPYDVLILSPGAVPVVPDIPGAERMLTLRDVADTDRIAAALPDARRAVVVGAGFIGLEMAENLTRRGIGVSLVELADQVLAPLDPEMAQGVAAELRLQGVDLRLGRQLVRVDPGTVTLDDGTTLSADVVIAAIGVRPDVALAESAGLELGPLGGILADEAQRTSDPYIYAVGDAVEKRDGLSLGPTLVPLANPANRQGRLVADAICGRDVHNAPVYGTAIVGVFDIAAAIVGWNERRLRDAQMPFVAIHTHPFDHAGYYPGAEQMALKLLFDPRNGRILGAQGVGGRGVDKRIDVIATAMRGGITAPGLMDLELAYAPQFGSAKDPVNMLGYIADNILSGTTETIDWQDVPGSGLPVVDVRTPAEYRAGSLPGAVNIPVDELRERIDEVPDACIVTCRVGQRGHVAACLLGHYGKRALNLDGGYLTWTAGRDSLPR